MLSCLDALRMHRGLFAAFADAPAGGRITSIE
jgi:hypothetical protein